MQTAKHTDGIIIIITNKLYAIFITHFIGPCYKLTFFFF